MRSFSFLTLAALATLTAAQVAPDAPAPVMELLEFDPPIDKFHLAETRDAPSTFRMRLRTRPRAPATVYLEAPNLKFGNCHERFDPTNWNEWRPVEVRALPYFTDADRARGEVISMRMSCPQGHQGWHARNFTYPVARPAGVKGATCSSVGDPHLRTFDGRSYDSMKLGTFYLVRSPALTIQTVTDAWTPGTSVSVATAIRYGPAHFIVDARESQGDKRLVRLSGDANGVDVVVSAAHNEFRFRFPNGAAVTITFHAANPRAYLDHQIEVPACMRDRTAGLCGTFDGKPDNDWALPNGALAANVDAFAEAWRVPPTDCVFTCRDRCPDALAAMHPIKPCDQCRIPTSLTGPGVFRDIQEGYIPFRAPRSRTTRGLPVYTAESRRMIAAPPPRVAAEFLERARRACTAALDVPEARHILAPRPYLEACVADCRLTGTLDMIDAKKAAYLNEVFTRVRPVLNLVAAQPASRSRRPSAYAASPEAVQCRRAADVLGLGSRRCPRDCSGNGTCLKGGCVCRPGFTGLACSTRLSAYGAPAVLPARATRPGAYSAPRHVDFDEEYETPRRPAMPVRRPVTPRRPLAHPRTPAHLDIVEDNGAEPDFSMEEAEDLDA